MLASDEWNHELAAVAFMDLNHISNINIIDFIMLALLRLKLLLQN
jgi:hypothetical protein